MFDLQISQAHILFVYCFICCCPSSNEKILEKQTCDSYQLDKVINKKQSTNKTNDKKNIAFKVFQYIQSISQLNKSNRTDLIVAYYKFQMKNLKKKQYVSQESSNQSFQLQLHQMKKLGLKKNMKKMTEGLWSLQENRIYLQFLINNQQDFKTQAMRRKCKVFYRISKLLKKRTPDQCRSHHQKLFNKNKRNYKKLIEQLIEKTQNSQNSSLLILERKGLSKTVQIQIINSKEEERKTMMVQQQLYEIIHKQKGLEIVIKLDNIKSW